VLRPRFRSKATLMSAMSATPPAGAEGTDADGL